MDEMQRANVGGPIRQHAFRVRGAPVKLYHRGPAGIVKASHVYPVESHPLGKEGGPTLDEFVASHPELQGESLESVQARSDAAKGLTVAQIRLLGLHPELDPAEYLGVVHAEVVIPE